MHIAIAGNIGSGKTTLTKMLADHYGWEARFEPVQHNPYLEDYYTDIQRWSFNLEIYFLRQRFKDILEIKKSSNTIVQDRSIYEGVYVFTENNYQMGNLSDRDYKTYMSLFERMLEMVSYPDLMIYLKSSIPHLVTNIQKRGREYEQTMRIEYLTNLNERYEEFIKKYKGELIILDVDELDYQDNPHDFQKILDMIESRLGEKINQIKEE